MKVTITYRNKEFKVRAGMTMRDAIFKCALHPNRVLPVCNGRLVTDDYILQKDDHIKLVAVISGGSRGTAPAP